MFSVYRLSFLWFPAPQCTTTTRLIWKLRKFAIIWIWQTKCVGGALNFKIWASCRSPTPPPSCSSSKLKCQSIPWFHSTLYWYMDDIFNGAWGLNYVYVNRKHCCCECTILEFLQWCVCKWYFGYFCERLSHIYNVRYNTNNIAGSTLRTITNVNTTPTTPCSLYHSAAQYFLEWYVGFYFYIYILVFHIDWIYVLNDEYILETHLRYLCITEECHRTALKLSHHWFKYWLSVIE